MTVNMNDLQWDLEAIQLGEQSCASQVLLSDNNLLRYAF